MLMIGVAVLICLYVTPTVQHHKIRAHDPAETLKLVHIVFRHGQKIPDVTYPNDPYVNSTFPPYGLGALTNEGKQLLFENGEWLRKRYKHYLDKLYVPSVVRAQATDYPRTIMSMAALLAGLYPPMDIEFKWNRRLNWQPIPIIAESMNEDTLLLLRSPCPRYVEIYIDIFKNSEVIALMYENKSLFEELTNITGLDIEIPDDIQSIYDILLGEQEYGFKLPDWTAKYYPDRLIPLTELSFILNVYTEEQKRLMMGPFLQKMINEWKEKRDGTLIPSERKIFLYAGHDTTIVNLFSAINVWQPQIPPFGVMAIFELHEDKKTGLYGVKVYMKTNRNNKAILLKIPGCDEFCPLDSFIVLNKKVLPKNLKTECDAKKKNFTLSTV